MEWSFAGGPVSAPAAESAEPPVRGGLPLPLAYFAQPQFPADAAASAGLAIVHTNNFSPFKQDQALVPRRARVGLKKNKRAWDKEREEQERLMGCVVSSDA